MDLARWEIGVLACLAGSFSGTLGGQLRICSLACCGRTATLLQIAGWTFWIGGQILNQVAILLAPAIVAACVVFSSSLLWNALLAPVVLHEQLTRAHCLGMLLLSTGGTVFTLASVHSDQAYSWPQLEDLGQQPLFMMTAGICFVTAFVILISFARSSQLDLWSFAFLFALTGSTDLLVTKYTLQLLRLLVVAKRHELPPGFVVTSAFSAMLVMHCFTFGFQVVSAYYKNALESLPLFLGSGAMLQVLLCGLFFNEFSGFDNTHLLALLAGFTLVLAGMLVTSTAVTATSAVSSPAESPGEISTVPSLPSFEPPTSLWKLRGVRPLAKKSISLSSSDLFMVSEFQKSAMVFRTKCTMPEVQPLLRRSGSAPHFTAPLLESCGSGKLHVQPGAASCPPVCHRPGHESMAFTWPTSLIAGSEKVLESDQGAKVVQV